MGYLILCIISSTGIFIIFKSIGHNSLPSFPVILINYLVAALIGFLIYDKNLSLGDLLRSTWIPISVLIGFLFIVMFFVVALSSSRAGISITTVASKMSVVFPISFSLLIGEDDTINIVKTTAIIATLAGVLMTVYQPMDADRKRGHMLIPLVLFVGMGLVDSLVKYAQHHWVSNSERALFSAVLFSMAFLTGLVILFFRHRDLRWFRNTEIWFWGIALGVVNFGSIFFLVSALNHVNIRGYQTDSSIIFGINNLGIVTLSVLTGYLVFREKLELINRIGVAVSLLAIILFSFA